MKEEQYEKAWNLLEAKGLTLGEIMSVRSIFAETFRNEQPNISATYKDGQIEYYHSTHNLINNLSFKTEAQAVLANAIYLNMNEIYGPNEFREILKFTFRIMGIENEWT